MMVFNRNRAQVFASKCGPSAMSSSPRSSSPKMQFEKYRFEYFAQTTEIHLNPRYREKPYSNQSKVRYFRLCVNL